MTWIAQGAKVVQRSILPTWSSKFCEQFFGHTAAKTLARWRWICDQKYSEDLMCLIHLLGQHLIDAPPFPFIHSEFESTHIPTFHHTIFHSLRFGSIWNTWSIIDQSVQRLGSDDQQFLLRTGHHQDTTTRSGDTPGGQKCLNLTINKKTLFIGTKCKLCFLHLAFSFFF